MSTSSAWVEGPRSEKSVVFAASARDVPIRSSPSPCPPCRRQRLGGWDKFGFPYFYGYRRVEGPSRAFNRRRVAALCEWRLDRSASGRALARQARAVHAQGHRVARSVGWAVVLAKPRSAAGAADRRSREGATAPRSDVRVKPGAPPERWPRASSRPRWPDDAKTPFKNYNAEFVPTARPTPARTVGDSSWRGQGRNGPKGQEGHEPGRVPHRPRSDQAGKRRRHSTHLRAITPRRAAPRPPN